MLKPDVINGLFEVCGGFFLLANVFKLYKDKRLRGYHWLSTVFFTAWGLWNLYFYPYLEQWVSFAGGIFIVIVNATWLGQIIYYSRKKVE
jgi:uncharacterized membrane protein YfcA